MTVHDLINLLLQQDPDAPVMRASLNLHTDHLSGLSVKEVTSIQTCWGNAIPPRCKTTTTEGPVVIID